MQQALMRQARLTRSQFQKISALVKAHCGINLKTDKKELVKSRLNKRLRTLNLSSFQEYIEYIERDGSGDELVAMLDALSTNVTSFFRESEHFDYLAHTILPRIIANVGGNGRRLRVWSAGCSSGEEPYSIAITICKTLPDPNRWDARILATDISTRVLARAEEGIYDERQVKDIPPALLRTYFTCVETRPERRFQVVKALRDMVCFDRLNLMGPWPMRGPFDVIFCRNVMIYFDKPTQNTLIQRFSALLGSGGTLFIGHSETLTGIRHELRYVRPTVYEKP